MSTASAVSPLSTHVQINLTNTETDKCKQLTLVDDYKLITQALIAFAVEEEIPPRLVDIEIYAAV